MLWPLGSCWPWRDCPSQDQPFPRDSKRPPWEGAFLCNNRPRAHTPMACFFLSSHRAHTLRATVYLPWSPQGPGTGHPGAGPVLQTPLKLFTLANPVLPVPSCRNNSKGSCAHFLWCSLPRGWPRTSPCGPSWRGMPLLWGTVNNKLFSVSGFSWLAGSTIYES